jgi:NAD(P)H dehydrogenase (quinone)
MPKVLVLYSSRTGSTAALADAIAEGARSVRFVEVDVRRIDVLAPAESRAEVPGWVARHAPLGPVEALAQYDAIIVGAPARDGAMAPELSDLFGRMAPLRAGGAMVNKVGSAFTSAGAGQAGPEATPWAIMTPMANLGMILVPAAPDEPSSSAGGGAAGAPAEAALASAHRQGKRVAEVVGWVTHARSHHHHH